MRSYLDGRQGWTTVLTLLTALVCLVTAQLSLGGVAAASGTDTGAGAAPYSTSVELHDRPVAAAVEARATAAQRDHQPPAAVAVPAAAPAEDLCGGEGWQQRRGAAALAALGPAATASGFRVEFGPARSGYMGLTHLQRGVVEVFVRDCAAQSDDLLRHVIAHELGHAYDTARMDDARRAAWQSARGIPASVPWYGCSGCADFATPAGDFAEVYAQWLRGASDNRSELAGAPAPAQLQQLAAQFFPG
ncbi:MAG TPA: hypothetical protein VM433_01555 [Mycobacteriales bacterium]|nr:hypothetical protein [Mycobacteriales bacterium]